MMTGRLYIDGRDAFTEWGVYAAEQGWNDLLSFPPLKNPEVNDWHERDGEETDLDAPALNARKVQVLLNCYRDTEAFMSFVAAMSARVYHTFDIRSLGIERTLRFVSPGSMAYSRGLVTARLTFSEDSPALTDDTSAPDGTAPDSDVTLDGVPLSRYNAVALEGLTAALLAPPQAKKGMSRDIAEVSGIIYDSGDTPRGEARDVSIPLLTRSASLAGLWKDRGRLLRDLVRPGERTLEAIGRKFRCRYKSCRVTAFWPDQRPWLQSTLTLRMTGAYGGD